VRRGNRTSDPHALGDLRLVEARSDAQGCDRVREGRGHSGFFRGLSCSYAVALGKAARLPGISIPDSSRRAPESAKWISQDLTKWFERVLPEGAELLCFQGRNSRQRLVHRVKVLGQS